MRCDGCETAQERRETAMPKTPTTPDRKDDRVYIRVSGSEKQILQEAARQRHLQVSQFALQASLDAAQAILMDQTAFALSADAWNAFQERLDTLPRELPRLQELLSEPRIFD
jgi:uncharacterized protein (DUF1778 family)